MEFKDNTLEILDKIGFTIKDGQVVKKEIAKEAGELVYCGFNTYLSKDGAIFEKLGNEYVELQSEESAAEKRFIKRHV